MDSTYTFRSSTPSVVSLFSVGSSSTVVVLLSTPLPPVPLRVEQILVGSKSVVYKNPEIPSKGVYYFRTSRSVFCTNKVEVLLGYLYLIRKKTDYISRS